MTYLQEQYDQLSTMTREADIQSWPEDVSDQVDIDPTRATPQGLYHLVHVCATCPDPEDLRMGSVLRLLSHLVYDGHLYAGSLRPCLAHYASHGAWSHVLDAVWVSGAGELWPLVEENRETILTCGRPDTVVKLHRLGSVWARKEWSRKTQSLRDRTYHTACKTVSTTDPS